MIRNFTDHAANERTFLAWIRTAIAVMAFGFLVAKFDLFLRIAAVSLGVRRSAMAMNGGGFGAAAGIVLIIAGTIMVALAAVRFVRTRRAIESEGLRAEGARIDLALGVLMVALGIALVFYVAETVLGSV
ncbi:MAG: YidH family protein [Acetobacteraceae bacterium]